jgi:Recombination endonuclease VII
LPYKDKAKRNEKNREYRKKWLTSAKNQRTQNLATANWRRSNPERADVIRRTAYLKKHYGITYDDYQNLLARYDYKCWICKKHQENFVKNLHVDHDHVDGSVRGLLCYTCNRQVIGRNRDPEIYLEAYKYLKGPYTGFKVPEKYLKGTKR